MYPLSPREHRQIITGVLALTLCALLVASWRVQPQRNIYVTAGPADGMWCDGALRHCGGLQ